jgi:hypothetical protein
LRKFGEIITLFFQDSLCLKFLSKLGCCEMSSPSFNLNFVLSIIPASFQKGLSPAVGYEEADG